MTRRIDKPGRGPNIFIPPADCRLLCLLLLVLTGGCVELDPVASERMANDASVPRNMNTFETMETLSPQTIYTAINNESRRPADLEQDKRRQAAEVLAFFDIQPGMAVLDLYSGGGYYAELLTYVVGRRGRVVAHNNTPYLKFAAQELATRFADGRLDNVERIVAENNELELPVNTFDAVIMIKAYHDLYFIDEAMGWPAIDRQQLLAEVFRALKPGGVFGIIDHIAEPGAAPEESAGTLHRIDQSVIVRDLIAAGFQFDDETDLLRNPADKYAISVFDPVVRGRTDRAVLKFRKP